MSGLRGDVGWRSHRARPENVSGLMPVIDTRPMTEWSHVERDAAGHNATSIRESEWWARRTSRWSWYRQRYADLLAVITARIAPDVMIPETDDAETILRVVAYHLQAANGSDRLIEALDAFCIEWAPWARIGASDVIEHIVADVGGRRRDLTAVRVGIELHVTWDERCRLGLRTIRPFDKTPLEFAKAARARKRQMDRDRAEVARRRKGVASWAERTWKARDQPWAGLGISRATYFRRQKLERDQAGSRETVASQLGEACRTSDATVSNVAETRRALVRAVAGLSPICTDHSHSNDDFSRDAFDRPAARLEDAAFDDALTPLGIPTRQPARRAA